MRKIVLPMMMTLDGFVAGPNGEMDWLPPFDDGALWEDLHEEMWTKLRSVDTLLLGRVTYQIWETFWPAAGSNPRSTKSDIEFSRFADRTQKVVFSKTLDKVEWKNTKLVRGDIAEEVSRLKEPPGKDLALAGGAGIAQTFMKLGLIDEYLITVHPVILGKGKLLFRNPGDRQKLRLVGTKRFRSGAVGLRYEPVR
ncbi:MAG TPA: dihydrofolate reductase family protein [Thermoplasmata archaeon]|nr:dihydrofolate reductase family protein [Thermoplasmata archaeon]